MNSTTSGAAGNSTALLNAAEGLPTATSAATGCADGTALPGVGTSTEGTAPDVVCSMAEVRRPVLQATSLPAWGAEESFAPVEFSGVCVVPGRARIVITPRPTSGPHIWDPEDNPTTAEFPGAWIVPEQGRILIAAEANRETFAPVEFPGVCVVPGQARILIIPQPTSGPHIWDPEDNPTTAEFPGAWIVPGRARILLAPQPAGIPAEPPASPEAAKSCDGVESLDLIRDSSYWKPSGNRIPPEGARTLSTELAGLLREPANHEVPSRRMEWRSSWQLLGERDFRLYFFGSFISNLGTWLQSTAQVLIAYQVTHSVFTVGLIASAQFAGMIAVSPWAAVLADKLSPRAILVGTQCASAIIAAWMAWRYLTGVLGVHSLVFGALGLGSVYALALPVQTALVPGLVKEADATDAVKMNSVSYNAGRALAPALCVLLIAVTGPYLIFTLNAISFVIFAIVLRHLNDIANDTSLRVIVAAILRRMGRVAIGIVLRVIFTVVPSRVRRTIGGVLLNMVFIVALGRPKGTGSETRANASPRPPRARVTDGLIIALHNRRILLLLAIVAAVTLADDPILVLSPALAHTTLDTSSQWAGYFIAALGWGSVLGSLPPTSVKSNSQNASRRAAFALLILGVSIVVFAMGFSTSVSLAAAFVAGGAGLFTGAAAQTALLRHQRKTGASLSSVASIAALWAIAWAGSKPFASFADGWLGSHIGIARTTLILATPAIAIASCEILLPKRIKDRIKVRAACLTLHIIPGSDFSPSPLLGEHRLQTAKPPRSDFTLSGDGRRGKPYSRRHARDRAHTSRVATLLSPRPVDPGVSQQYWEPRDARGLRETPQEDALQAAGSQGA